MDNYKCWDCEKELGNLEFNEEIKQACPKSSDGSYLVICNYCVENGDY